MKIEILLNRPQAAGSFADVKLGFVASNGIKREVNLNINFQSLDSFSNNTSNVAFDFFFISAIVYGVDSLLDRHRYSIDCWARDIEICFPVNNLQVWQNHQEELEGVLSFLTGDYWTVTFCQTTITRFYRRKRRIPSYIRAYHHEDYSFASLFSGGLDSLVGVVNELEKLRKQKKGLLISHFDSTSPGANRDQERLSEFLGQPSNYGTKFDWLQSRIYLSTHDNSGEELNKESSYRSRSLLFIGIGVFCVESIPNGDTLIIPENGTISLNYPLTPSRSSTLSTRTTHPHYLNQLQNLLNSLGLSTKIVNPYMSFTKGELIESCTNKDILEGIYEQSVSCGKRGRKQYWDTREGTQHCGVCMPCIYRRAGLHKLSLDNQLYGTDIFTTRKDIRSIQDMPALFDFLERPLTTEEIKRTLLVSGSLEIDDLSISAGLVERVREEIKEWINDKGNRNLKRLAGL